VIAVEGDDMDGREQNWRGVKGKRTGDGLLTDRGLEKKKKRKEEGPSTNHCGGQRR